MFWETSEDKVTLEEGHEGFLADIVFLAETGVLTVFYLARCLERCEYDKHTINEKVMGDEDKQLDTENMSLHNYDKEQMRVSTSITMNGNNDTGKKSVKMAKVKMIGNSDTSDKLGEKDTVEYIEKEKKRNGMHTFILLI